MKLSRIVFIPITALFIILLVLTFIGLPKIHAWYKPDYSTHSKSTVFDLDSVKFSIEPVEDYYLSGETIWLRILIENNSHNMLITPTSPDSWRGIKFGVTDDKGNSVESDLGISCALLLYPDTTSYTPGEKYSILRNLNNYYIEKAGKIKVTAYHNGMIASTEIDIQEPKGYDILMYNQLHNRTDYYDFNKFDENRYENTTKYLFYYPDSKYAPEIYEKLLRALYRKHNYDGFLIHFENYMNKYSDNPSTKEIVGVYCSYLKSREDLSNEQIREELVELVYKYPQSLNLRNYVIRFIEGNFSFNIRRYRVIE